MRPQSKRQVLVCQLSSQLPDLKNKLSSWAFKNCIAHIGHRNKMWTHCLSCGEVWPTTSMRIKSEICTGCGWKIILETTRKQKSTTFARFALLDVKGDFQVVRYFNITCDMKVKQKPKSCTREIMQHWILPDGDFEIISAQVGGLGLSYDHFGSFMSLKNKKDLWKYNIPVYKIHPEMTLLPIYSRNGFVSSIQDIRPFDVLKSLKTDSKTETLIKTNQFGLLRQHLSDRNGSVYRFWSSVKICIRSGYIVKEAGMWLDYLELLHWFSKDLRNPKYVCPGNLLKEHDRLVKKKTDLEKRQDLERRKQEVEKEQLDYVNLKSAFFGITFTDRNLKLKVLESVQEFIEESDVHKHCVYSARYYAKPDSLVFSAKVNGKPVETVEVSISKMQVVQSRGLQNKASEYNERIVNLLNKNMPVIALRTKKEKEPVS